MLTSYGITNLVGQYLGLSLGPISGGVCSNRPVHSSSSTVPGPPLEPSGSSTRVASANSSVQLVSSVRWLWGLNSAAQLDNVSPP